MPRSDMPFARPERPYQQIGIPEGNIQQVPLAGSQIMGTGRLEEMTGVIELMTKFIFLYPALHPRPGMRMQRVDRPGRIQIAVRFLRPSDDTDQRIYIRLERRIGMHGQRKGSPLDGLIDVRVVEGIFGAELAAPRRGHFKILDPARTLA